MQIVVIGGNYLNEALSTLGHQIFWVNFDQSAHWCMTRPFFVKELLGRLELANFKPEALFYCDNGNLPLLVDPETLPFVSIWYSIDTYCNPWHIPYGYGFDLVLVAQKDFVGLFLEHLIFAKWLPLFCRSSLISQEFKETRDVPVSFVGSLGHKNNPKRAPFLKKFKAEHPLVFYQGDFKPLFIRSQIVLNQTAYSEVNFRCFEAIACGAALLTETCQNGQSELFKIGEEILPTYRRDNHEEAIFLAKKYLADPLKLAQIAKRGRERVSLEHTDLNRAKTLISEFTNLLESQALIKRKQEQERLKVLVGSAFGVLACDLANDPKFSHYASFYSRFFVKS